MPLETNFIQHMELSSVDDFNANKIRMEVKQASSWMKLNLKGRFMVNFLNLSSFKLLFFDLLIHELISKQFLWLKHKSVLDWIFRVNPSSSEPR